MNVHQVHHEGTDTIPESDDVAERPFALEHILTELLKDEHRSLI